MNRPDKEEQRRIVRGWEETGAILERMRMEKLRGKPYDWREVDALLSVGDAFPQPSRISETLGEMNRLYLEAMEKRAKRGGEGEDEKENPRTVR